MAQKLSQYRRSSLDRLMTEKMRIEAIVNSLHEPIIGLDSERNILFMNDEAFSILNLKRGNVIGRNAAEIAINNDLLRRLIRELYSNRESDGPHEPLKIYADNKESYFQMDNIPLYTNAVGEQERNFIGNLIILNNVTKYKELDSGQNQFHFHRIARDEDPDLVDSDEPPVAGATPGWARSMTSRSSS